jgi:hypothetical protein
MLTRREQVRWRLMVILLRSYDKAGESRGRSRRDVLINAMFDMSHPKPEDDDYDQLDREILDLGAWVVLDHTLKSAEELGPTPKQLTLWIGKELEIEITPDRWLAGEIAWHHYLAYLADMAGHDRFNQLSRDELRAADWIWRLFPIDVSLPHAWQELVGEVRSRRLDKTIRWLDTGNP